MNEILRNAEKEIEEEKQWRERRGEMRLTPVKENITGEIAPNVSQTSMKAVSVETLPADSQTLSESLRPAVLKSAQLAHDSASALHSHMSSILDIKDNVRIVPERTTQATQCAREIALLLKAKSDLLRVLKEV